MKRPTHATLECERCGAKATVKARQGGIAHKLPRGWWMVCRAVIGLGYVFYCSVWCLEGKPKP